MKIAVLIFGEHRTFKTAVQTWNCRFWDDVDYYMSTWDISESYSEPTKHLDTPIIKNNIDTNFIKDVLPNVNLKITNSHMTPVLVKAIQELSETNKKLTSRIEELEKK